LKHIWQQKFTRFEHSWWDQCGETYVESFESVYQQALAGSIWPLGSHITPVNSLLEQGHENAQYRLFPFTIWTRMIIIYFIYSILFYIYFFFYLQIPPNAFSTICLLAYIVCFW